jgi:hypothetical protein
MMDYMLIRCTVWLLRSWKLGEMEKLGLTKAQREADIQDDDVVRQIASNAGTTTTRISLLSYITNMVVIERV